MGNILHNSRMPKCCMMRDLEISKYLNPGIRLSSIDIFDFNEGVCVFDDNHTPLLCNI